MHALRLITRYKGDGVEEEACLLVYDSATLSGTVLSDDVRDHFNQRPITKRLYIMAPFVSQDRLRTLLFEGSLFDRVKVIFKNFAGAISILLFRKIGETQLAGSVSFSFDANGGVVEGSFEEISDELRNGWLFSLFDLNKGLVSAPEGVHFGKGSRKHSAKFLRTSAVLLTSEACAVIAYFSLASSVIFQPRRIFVDTAPLISVAFALQRIAIIHGLWESEVQVSSFSSYGGVDRLPRASRRDLALISASTSGGLVQCLLDKGFNSEAVLLLFFLGSNTDSPPGFKTVCDLTYRRGLLYGYAAIENFSSTNCPLCAKGYFLAALEGDQFLLESRAVKELVVRTKTQPKEARDSVELLARNRVFRVPMFANSPQRFEFDLDFDALKQCGSIRDRIVKILRRYTPVPLDCIILVDIGESLFKDLLTAAGLTDLVSSARIVNYSELRTVERKNGAGVLVFVGCLKEYSKIRDINAELRTIAENGCVAYLSAITLAESPEQLMSLRNFLTYGANGRDSFSFVSAITLMLPFNNDERSSWDRELELLRKIADEGNASENVKNRLEILNAGGALFDGLFWPGRTNVLTINNDFVYLNTDSGRESVTQADLYVVVANLLASVRIGDRGVGSPVQNEPVRWQQSVYGQTLLSVTNFEDYNDAVLRASFIRAATSAELNYSAHPASSSRMLEILRQGIKGWEHNMGDFLPEFLISLATQRLILTDVDTVQLKRLVNESSLPDFMKTIAQFI